ncbi:nitrogenase component 1 [Candidatus Formimonas warabiya]|uniref:Nitrogenase n=1 Tax=Formimonas warabiya TaxID=1761012 RepID=A0A3G1KZR6_FORW1|nr:nitrogenase component 1 [Candidatus Formimonas warabiya]ATW28022.1 nitrogenase [Candidatus Formimonas warabiya]
MAINLQTPEVEIRENRLNSVLSYQGSAKDLCAKSAQRLLPCRDNSFNQCGDCSAQRAFLHIAQIRDTAVVNHGPIGCAGDFAIFNAQFRGGCRSKGYPVENIRALSTNLQERDTVYGGGEKLAETIREAYRRFHPKAIFVNTSCASGIIGDDIDGVVDAAEKELGIPIVPIYCEGFKSQVWTTGFDAAFHGILRKIVKPPKEKRADLITIFNFVNEDVFTPLLAKIGLKAKCLVVHSSIEELERISEAAATSHICETLGTYIAKGLEQEYGVPEIKSPPPFGFAWTDAWLREIGKITHKEKEVEALIQSEREHVEQELAELRKKLEGKTAYIVAGASFGHSILSMARDLGIEVVGITGFHHDQRFDNEDDRINSLKNAITCAGDIQNYHVCNKQPYQLINIIRALKPDLLLARHDNMVILGTKLGIPSVYVDDANLAVGYAGVINTGRKIIQVMQTKNFIKNIAKHVKFPYTDWWYQQDPFAFQRGELGE